METTRRGRAGFALALVVGLCVAITGWQQPAPSVARTLRYLRRPAAVAPSATGRYLNGSVMQWAAAGARRFPRLLPTDVQLRLVGRSLEGHIARVGGAAALGVVAPVVFVTAMRSAGMIGLRWFVPVVLAVLAGAVCAVVVHLTTVERAAIRARPTDQRRVLDRAEAGMPRSCPP